MNQKQVGKLRKENQESQGMDVLQKQVNQLNLKMQSLNQEITKMTPCVFFIPTFHLWFVFVLFSIREQKLADNRQQTTNNKQQELEMQLKQREEIHKSYVKFQLYYFVLLHFGCCC